MRCRLVAIIALAIVASSCGSSPSTPVAASGSTTTSVAPATTTTAATSPAPLPLAGSGVRGRLTAGPTCPVERADQPCPPQPVPGTVTAIDSRGATAGSASTDVDGRYAIDLPPGDYTLRVTTANGTLPRCPETPVTITDGPPATADIDCDTGIR